ncbi:MAG: pyridoxal phosphate-dependent aminotransferase [Acholeplasmatales bacterium]|nr:pyridoxal phosphate-dependent aminotransferase [Acholeplasmatales bacterium]MBR6288590.1 pyridoxal phosphate-dependent aminotransferase [Acholeplasmatales bacterium]
MNKKMLELGNNRSIIRELFEFSKIQKEKYGADKVYDFTLGNPSVPPHKAIDETIIELLNTKAPSYNHGYTSAPGDNEVRKAIADDLNKRFGTNYKFTNFYMTCGAAASLCITLKALTESNTDEILAMAPYFTEYKVFVEAAGATFGIVPANETFGINFAELDKMINKNTKAIIVNSPNNPSGVVYSEDELKKFAELLLKKEKEFNHSVYLICDEPYREIVYDGLKVPHIPSIYHNTVICYSYSKCLSLPGDRIGYILVPDQVDDSKDLYAACLGAGRALGYVCAPSLYQKVIERCATLTSDMNEYKKNRDLLYNGLKKVGFECVYPQGAFYLFVKSPEADANKFMEKAKKYNIVIVPSDGFGVKGYVRLAYCVSSKVIIDSMPAFEKLYNEYK